MAKYSYELVMDMMEYQALGYNFDEYYYDHVGNIPKKIARKAWNNAVHCNESEKYFQNCLLERAKAPFEQFVAALDDYYQQGFGAEYFEEIFGINRAVFQEMLSKRSG